MLERARAAGVTTLLAIGSGPGPEKLDAAIPFAEQHDWIYASVGIQDGAVTRFVTSMTGELYDVLGAHSVLRFAEPQTEDPIAFSRGVTAAGDGGGLAARLFGLRGLTVSDELAAQSAASYLSGLLIGAEIAALWPMLRAGDHEAVDLLGDGRLCALYQRALAMRGVSSAIADGDQAVRDGLAHIWKAAS